MYLAARDIIEESLKVRAGKPLPERFQNYMAVKNLRQTLGKDIVVDLSVSDDYVMVPIKLLSPETRKSLQAELAALGKSKAGGSKQKEQ